MRGSVKVAPVARPDHLRRAHAILDELSVDALLVSGIAGKRWLSGFRLQRGDEPTSGYSGTLLVTRERQLVLVDSRYDEQAAAECAGWEVRRTEKAIEVELPPLAAELGARRIGAEAAVLSHADWIAVAAGGLDLVAADQPVNALRLIKDPAEVAAIQRACELTDRCFAHLLTALRPGMTEREVAWELEGWFRANGAEDLAFDPLVLVGARAAMPHGSPSDVPVTRGQALLIDFGCQVDGYRSDMTRTVFFGEPPDDVKQRYRLVRDAQQRAREGARPGMAGIDLDGIARRHLEEAGLGEAFSHGLGHGIGLETHERPMLKDWRRPLEAGMVFTLEPGVYLPGEIGIRIEDVVHLTDAGARDLTNAPREMIVL
jgi:Xaa-Pro aminopeptidase